MTLESSIRKIFSNAKLGLTLVPIAIGVILIARLFSKHVLKKQVRKSYSKHFITAVFIAYMVTLISVTFLDRSGSFYEGKSNLILFSSYREAWANLNISTVLFLVLNILMTIPLGLLLPLLDKRFENLKYFLSTTFLIILGIETLQFILKRGIFDVDDILNNLVGALIGFGLCKIFLHIKNEKSISIKKLVLYLTPIIITTILFAGAFTYYQIKPYGNLRISFNKNFNMKNAEFIIDDSIDADSKTVQLGDLVYDIDEVPIYKRSIENPISGIELFNNLIDNQYDEASISQYDFNGSTHFDVQDSSIFLIFDDSTQYFFMQYIGYEEINNPKKEVSVEQAIADLQQFDFEIPNIPAHNVGNAFYWKLENDVKEGELTTGTLSIQYTEDGCLQSINNEVGNYKQVALTSIRTPNQAIDQIRKGHIPLFHIDSIQSLEVIDLKLNYTVDSKDFLQPIYEVNTLINGDFIPLYIPALN